jgi:cell wall-associated NlpC family hydrolase
MRCSRSSVAAFSLLLLACHGGGRAFADPSSPRERSFRPLVPIAQSVRSGSGAVHSQSVRVSIADRPETSAPVVDPAKVSATSIPSAPASSPAPEPVLTAAADSPPEPKPTTEPSPESSAAAEPESPGGSKTPPATAASKKGGPTLSQLRDEAHALAGKKLTYVFGAADPDSGGLDCSSTIQYLLTKIGVQGVPRTSYDQYYWLKRKNLLDDVYASKSSSSKLLKKLSPGDLIFWGGTWKSGHRVSHVMLYMGYDPKADKHYVFGARSKSVTGLTGAGVDIFELDTERGRLVAHGKIPGLVYE